MKHTIDASGKKLGRIATEAAVLLMGKTTPDFKRNQVSSNVVKIKNASALNISIKKKKNTIYTHYTGYPGGLREQSMQKIIDKKGWIKTFLHGKIDE